MGRYRNRKFSSDWIHKMEPLDRWISYWYQVKLMTEYVKEGDKMIELGLGTGFLANYFRSRGVNVFTLDIDKNKKPDLVIDAINFHPSADFDHFCAFEVFEHLEYDEMEKVLDNIKDHVRKNIFISVPIFRKTPINLVIKMKSKWITVSVPLPKWKIKEEHHRWELGYKEYYAERLISDYNRRGFFLQNRLNYFRWRYFHFVKNSN